MGEMGYRLSNVSEREIEKDPERFFRKAQGASFPFLSSNLIYRETAKPIAEPYRIEEFRLPSRTGRPDRPLRVGILGLNRHLPGFGVEAPGGGEIITEEPGTAVAPILEEFRRRKVGLVIALVHMGLREAREFARTVPGIDLVLGGRGSAVTSPVDRESKTKFGRTRVLLVGNQGKRLGELRLFFDQEFRLVRVERQLIHLSPKFPVDEAVDRKVKETRQAVNDWRREHVSTAGRMAGGEEGSRAMRAGFIGSDTCGSCHEEAYRIWVSSAHAHSFDILMNLNQDFNPRCVGCHTTGRGQPSGFRNARATPGQIHVQCEACHGPGGAHASEPSPGYGREGAGDCLTCHTAENSPDFHRQRYWDLIAH